MNITVMMDDVEITEYETEQNIIPRISETINLQIESNGYKWVKYRVFDVEHCTEVYNDKSSDTNIILHVFKA